MKQVLFVVAVMAQQDAKLYLISWRSLISGEVDFCEKVLAASPEEAIKIAGEIKLRNSRAVQPGNGRDVGSTENEQSTM